MVIQDTLNQLSIGDHIFISGCAYQITQVYTGTDSPVSFDSFSTSFNCNQQCNTTPSLIITILTELSVMWIVAEQL